MKTRRRQRKSRGGNRYIALDCEMVEGPKRRPMLAEVALVDWNGDIVYHSYVQPTGPVADYREEISGIKPDMLLKKNGARPFKEVQAAVIYHLRNKILVGHALENDLGALKLEFPSQYIRNTAHHSFFQTLHRYGQLQPQKLSKLYNTYVGNTAIQTGAHGAIEDARASMRVYKSRHRNWATPVVHYGPINTRRKN
jgi:RNA exonuclease 4